jgi:hypothetical protein
MFETVAQSFAPMLVLTPPVAGYWLAHMPSSRLRSYALTVLLLFPLIVLTIVTELLSSGSPGENEWAFRAVFMSPLTALWAMLAGAGYLVGRQMVR